MHFACLRFLVPMSLRTGCRAKLPAGILVMRILSISMEALMLPKPRMTTQCQTLVKVLILYLLGPSTDVFEPFELRHHPLNAM